MRRIVNSTYITLDGVIEEPQDWPTLGSADDAGGQIHTVATSSSTASASCPTPCSRPA